MNFKESNIIHHYDLTIFVSKENDDNAYKAAHAFDKASSHTRLQWKHKQQK